MPCPIEEELLAAEIGELPENDVRALSRHEAGCPRCRAERRDQRRLLDDLAAPAGPPLVEDAFVEEVMRSCRAADLAPPARRGKAALGAAGAGAAILAAFAVWIAVPAVPAAPPVPPGWVARGSSHVASEPVSLQVLRARGDALTPIGGASLRAGDGVAVRYWNRAEEPVYLALFGIDARGDVHWFYPAYDDPASNPRSISLEKSAEGRLLGEIVEPERPAAGPFRVVAITSEERLSVKTVEERIERSRLSIAESFPNARVQEWSFAWVAR